VALGVGAIWVALQALINGTPADSVPWWFPLIFAVPFVSAAILLNRAIYIRVNGSAIMFSPTRFGHREFPRQDLARIQGVSSGLYGRVAFLRTDGSTVQSIPGSMWGRAGLQSLADYLGIPFDGAHLIRSYWDFGRWS
jgi:hypothetical protein